MTDDLEMIYQNAKQVFADLAELRLLAAKIQEVPTGTAARGVLGLLYEAGVNREQAFKMARVVFESAAALSDLLGQASGHAEALRDVADDAIQEIGQNRLI